MIHDLDLSPSFTFIKFFAISVFLRWLRGWMGSSGYLLLMIQRVLEYAKGQSWATVKSLAISTRSFKYVMKNPQILCVETVRAHTWTKSMPVAKTCFPHRPELLRNHHTSLRRSEHSARRTGRGMCKPRAATSAHTRVMMKREQFFLSFIFLAPDRGRVADHISATVIQSENPLQLPRKHCCKHRKGKNQAKAIQRVN